MLKPSTLFARWIKANSASLEGESEEFKFLVTQVSFYLDMLEMAGNRKHGISPGAADSAKHLFERFQTDAKAKGYELPAITLPKIKVVRPPPTDRTGGH